jgi:hypothetical protein
MSPSTMESMTMCSSTALSRAKKKAFHPFYRKFQITPQMSFNVNEMKVEDLLLFINAERELNNGQRLNQRSEESNSVQE